MSTIRTNAILDASGGTNATINGITPINTASVLSTFNATGSAPVYACRAWVNFNGIGTVAIRASGNVSSITDNGTGDYTVNFATAMPDANYAPVFGSMGGTLTNISSGMVVVAGVSGVQSLKTTTQIRIQVGSSANGIPADSAEMNVAIFR